MSSAIHQVPLIITGTIEPDPTLTASSEPVSCSLPLAVGIANPDVGCAIVDEQGQSRDVQTSVLGHWPDGSAKWLLLECSVPAARGRRRYVVNVGAAPATNPALLAFTDGRHVRLHSSGVVISLTPHGSVELTRNGDTIAHITIDAICGRGRSQRLDLETVSIESNGSQRATILASGHFQLEGATINAELRLSTYGASSRIRCDLTLHNPRGARHPGNFWELGDPGSVFFKSVAVTLHRLRAPGSGDVFFAECPGRWLSATGRVSIYQESSGGPNWRSSTHVDRFGVVPMKLPGYVVERPGGRHDGARAEPSVQIIDQDYSWAGTLLRFFEEFPSAISADPEQGIVLEPFPAAFPALHEIQGGERKTRTCVFTHGAGVATRSEIELAIRPSSAAFDAADLRASGVFPFLDAAEDPRHSEMLRAAVDGPNSFFAKRERIDGYGWRTFGDLHADHESGFLAGSTEYVSHYNNQYDAIFGFGLQFLRTGDERWWRLMDDLARHVADIDIYHTTEDRAAYAGGMFWHTYHYSDAGKSSHRSYPRAEGMPSGGPAAEHNYNVGLALHYLLTGWLPSKDAALGLARWVLNMDDGSKTPFRWLSGGYTGLASASGDPLYHAPGRGGGNSIMALLAGYELSGAREYLTKAEQLIRRCIHPADDLAALNLLDAERRWYYTVFLEAVGRYLWLKWERNELDETYDYARRALLHYARWMHEYEYPYLEKPEILEYPTQTWSAQDMRKSDVLAWAALCERGENRTMFLDASKRFFDDVLTRLPSLPGVTYTRPLVLMLTRGYAHAWVSAHPEAFLPPGVQPAADPPPSRFVPQKVIAMQRARVVVAIAAAMSLLLVLLLFVSG